MSVALLGASYIFLAIFMIFASSSFKNREKEKYDLRNHFCFEILPLKTSNDYILYMVMGFLYLASFLANFIYFTITDFGVMNVFIAFISLLITFSIGVIFFLPLSKLKERSIFSIVLIASVALQNALLIYEETFLIKAYENNLVYVSIVINALLLLLAVIAMFSPRLFDFALEKNEDGTTTRKKIYPLALFEWLLIISAPLSQLSIVIIEIIKK